MFPHFMESGTASCRIWVNMKQSKVRAGLGKVAVQRDQGLSGFICDWPMLYGKAKNLFIRPRNFELSYSIMILSNGCCKGIIQYSC